MSKPGEKYIKEISPIYTESPEIVQLKKQQYIIQKTWKIGNKRNDDMSRADFIDELECVDMIDVNQYKVDYLR